MQNKNFINSEPIASESSLQQKIQAQTAPTPNNPPWFVWAAVGTWVLSVLFIVIFPNLFLFPYLLNQPINLSDSAAILEFAKSDPTAVLLQVISIIPAHILTLLTAWLLVTNFRKFSFRQTLGWDSGSFSWWNYPILFVGVFAAAALVQRFFPAQENDLERMLQTSHTVLYVVAFLATFTAPLVEEVIYRGILYSAFQRKFGIAAAVAITTGLFALVHVPQYYPSYSTIFIICLLSLILTLIRVKSKNLLPCIIFHTIFNGVQSAVLVASTFFPDGAKLPAPEHAGLFLKLFW